MGQRICTVPGCGKPQNARGWCKGHYYRWARYGDPRLSAPAREPRPRKQRERCTVVECRGLQYARGWCENHYARWRRHGDLHDKRAEIGDPSARFWSRVDKTGTCWLWTGPPNSSGYGRFNPGGGSPLGAHVFAVILDGRVIPTGMEVDHLCNVRLCVRPDHLEVVTHAVNVRRARDRARIPA